MTVMNSANVDDEILISSYANKWIFLFTIVNKICKHLLQHAPANLCRQMKAMFDYLPSAMFHHYWHFSFMEGLFCISRYFIHFVCVCVCILVCHKKYEKSIIPDFWFFLIRLLKVIFYLLLAGYNWASGQFSTWTESVWDVFQVRVFLIPSQQFQVRAVGVLFVWGFLRREGVIIIFNLMYLFVFNY